MKLLSIAKDGGKESTVTGYWLIEIKSLFSIVLLRFDHGSREAYHSHAFNCISWILKGQLEEKHLGKSPLSSHTEFHYAGFKPIITKKKTFHKVYSHGTTWVLSFRGPWAKEWKEYVDGEEITLTHGRKVVE